jgi:hypothetical protein
MGKVKRKNVRLTKICTAGKLLLVEAFETLTLGEFTLELLTLHVSLEFFEVSLGEVRPRVKVEGGFGDRINDCHDYK